MRSFQQVYVIKRSSDLNRYSPDIHNWVKLAGWVWYRPSLPGGRWRVPRYLRRERSARERWHGLVADGGARPPDRGSFLQLYRLFCPSAVLLCRQFVHGHTSSDGPRTGARAAPGPQGRSLAGPSSKILSHARNKNFHPPTRDEAVV